MCMFYQRLWNVIRFTSYFPRLSRRQSSPMPKFSGIIWNNGGKQGWEERACDETRNSRAVTHINADELWRNHLKPSPWRANGREVRFVLPTVPRSMYWSRHIKAHPVHSILIIPVGNHRAEPSKLCIKNPMHTRTLAGIRGETVKKVIHNLSN